MRTKIFIVTVVAALAAATVALAGNGPANARFSFLGKLTSTPSNGGVSITVEGGNRLALRAMLGAPVTQTFKYDGTTEFLKWSNGAPAVVQPGALAVGDYVWVHVRAPRSASLADVEARAAGVVGDHGATLDKPNQPLYLFRGTLSSVGAGTLAVHVAGGNHRALKLLIGASSDQSFAFGDGTIVILWQGKVPTVIDPTKLVVGDRVVVRIRADRNASLAQVEATAANHIGDREPASAK